ncbi:MAG: helix-turn-helix domain-containing protein, partial [Clostridia bacterium]|nr:helix-turn-helix domain-containing protein [Clostridia bacterium]
MKLGNKLLEVRENAGISRSQLSDFLLEKGFDVKPYTIGKWETGVSNPSVEAFLAICDICKVSDIQQTFGDKRSLRLYDISVSAGCGNYLNSSDYDVIGVDNTVPASADYAVRVVGDSMM